MSFEVRRFEHGSRVPDWDRGVDLRKDPSEVPDPATTPVPAEVRAEIEAAMAKYPDHRSAALPALHTVQRHHGWCSPEAIEQAACVMRLTPGYLTAVATFYDMFDTVPVGRHRVYVCTNISCSLNGADEVYARIKAAAADDAEIDVRKFECLGACDIAPMASVDGTYVGPIELGEVDELLDDIRADRDPLPRKQLARRPAAETLPLQPTTYGGEMPGEAPGGPVAPIEQAPEGPAQSDETGDPS